MRRELQDKDCTFTGASDLTVLAPIRKGFVPGLDAVTYKTRVERVLRTLHAGRTGLHESELARMLSDAVERVGRIHSVRIAVLEPHDQVLLAVTFDGAWEAYVRVIWQKVARLLDLIFCNTEGYVNGWESSFEDWGAWLRWRQAETSFLYAVPGLTVDDTVLLRMQERLAQAGPRGDLEATRLVAPSAEEIGAGLLHAGMDPTTLPPGTPLRPQTEAKPAVFRQGLRSLAGLYRLADLYPPTSAEGELLLRAAHELLPEFQQIASYDSMPVAWERAKDRFSEQLDWFAQPLPTPHAREPSLPPAAPALHDPQELQGGILEPYGDTDHGALVLLRFDSAQGVHNLLQAVRPTTREAQLAGPAPGERVWNLAFSLEGLRVAGLTDAEVDALPTEFVHGMERRAAVLGDLRINHPRRWRLPVRNWHQGAAAPDAGEDTPGERVPLESVHAVLQVRRMRVTPAESAATARPQLFGAIDALLQLPGVQPLSIQWLNRLHSQAGAGHEILDHFDFQDSDSDPALHQADAGKVYPNHVHVGEALLGYPNAGDVDAPRFPGASDWLRDLLDNGSFLVVRKLRQDRAVLEDALAAAGASTGLGRDTLLAKMMGRWPHGNPRAGEPLVELPASHANDNDFDFTADPQGSGCPVHSHIRRANPRTRTGPEEPAGGRAPRLFRRSLSYGPACDRNSPASLAEERGLLFMAYNASIGEQFEVVQRWVAGGNSSQGHSGQPDPFLGVPEAGRVRRFRFEDAGGGAPCVHYMQLDGDSDLLAEPRPLVRLEWGGYFLAPSLGGLDLLAERAQDTAGTGMPGPRPREPLAWSVDEGSAAIAALRQVEASEGVEAVAREWKAALEDPQAAADFRTASIWAAIRQRHGGVLRTPYGVLVADGAKVGELLMDPQRRLTSTAYLPRMQQSFGTIYLGMDAGAEDRRYETESDACNTAIMDLARTPADQRRVFDEALDTVKAKLEDLAADARQQAQEDEFFRRGDGASRPRDRLHWEVTLDVRELVDELLAHFCEAWFGLGTQGGLLQRSGFRWTWRPGEPACYPGHFMAPSRYIFQPHPEEEVERVGIAHGQGILAAVTEYLQAYGAGITAPVTRQVLGRPPAAGDMALAARTLVGAIMGMVPTVDANLRRVMDRWLAEGTLWSLRARLQNAPDADLHAAIEEAFRTTMQSRVAPDTLWRTARRGHTLGGGADAVRIAPGDVLVAGLGSVAHEAMEQGGAPQVDAAFGGNRFQPPHPTHACPGYEAALAMMQGFVAALVRSGLPLRPGPGPLTLAMSGHVAYAPPHPAQAPAPALAPVPAKGSAEAAPPEVTVRAAPEGARSVWTYGDSWLIKGVVDRASLASVLEDAGYRVHASRSEAGRTLASMAADVRPAGQAHRGIAAELVRARPGQIGVLIVGGGGNDVTNRRSHQDSRLHDLLVAGAATPAAALDASRVEEFIDVELAGHYQAMLRTLLEATAHLDLPILVHAYARPIADGRCPLVMGLPIAGPAWLEPVFHLKGMRDRIFNTAVMGELIDRLNQMVQRVVGDLGGGRLQHFDLRGQLVEQFTDPGLPHHQDWDDELHPTRDGCRKLTAALAPAVHKLVA